MSLFVDFIKLTDVESKNPLFILKNEIIMLDQHAKGTLVWLRSRPSEPRLVCECIHDIWSILE
jgi:hypothetical protein